MLSFKRLTFFQMGHLNISKTNLPFVRRLCLSMSFAWEEQICLQNTKRWKQAGELVCWTGSTRTLLNNRSTKNGVSTFKTSKRTTGPGFEYTGIFPVFSAIAIVAPKGLVRQSEGCVSQIFSRRGQIHWHVSICQPRRVAKSTLSWRYSDTELTAKRH